MTIAASTSGVSHRLIANKIANRPALLDRAKDTLRRWQQSQAVPSSTFAEWDVIISRPIEEVVDFLVERCERATRLRQSTPFCGILTEVERRAIYESYSTRAYHSRREPHLG